MNVLYWICVLNTFIYTVVNHFVLLGVSQSYAYFFKIHFSCHFYSDIVEINILSYQQFKNPKLLHV